MHKSEPYCLCYRSRRPIGLGNRRTLDLTIGLASWLTSGDRSKRWGRNLPRSGTRNIINISKTWVHVNWDISVLCKAILQSITQVPETKYLHGIMIIWWLKFDKSQWDRPHNLLIWHFGYSIDEILNQNEVPKPTQLNLNKEVDIDD